MRVPENLKILLIEPPFYRLYKDSYSNHCHPLNLGYLAGTIQKDSNWNVVSYNSDFNPLNETIRLNYMIGAGFENYLYNIENISGQVWDEVRKANLRKAMVKRELPQVRQPKGLLGVFELGTKS